MEGGNKEASHHSQDCYSQVDRQKNKLKKYIYREREEPSRAQLALTVLHSCPVSVSTLLIKVGSWFTTKRLVCTNA